MSSPSRLAALAVIMLCVPVDAHDPAGRIRALDGQIEQQPNSAALYLRRGELHRHLGHLVQAFADLDRARKLDSGLREVHLCRALALIDAGRHTAALGSIECYLAGSPRSGFGSLIRARLLRRAGRGREAAREYDRALALIPCPEPGHFLEQAKAHAALGEPGKARAIECLRGAVASIGPVVSLTGLGRKLGVDLTRVPRRPLPASAATTAPTSPIPTTFHGDTVVVPFGANWRYKDDGTDQGSLWRTPNFDDSKWSRGPAQLGYGDGDEKTIVSFGNDLNNKHITTYFRTTFRVPGGIAIAQARVRVVRDDGIVVYLNGTEIVRNNMPLGPVDYTTPASFLIRGAEEYEILSIPFDHRALRSGVNVLAVETHQISGVSTDISHDLELRVSSGLTSVVRGPYLQQGGTTSAILRWRTDYPTETVAFLGSSVTNLKAAALNRAKTTEHTALVRGLKPNTTYFYGIGSIAGILKAGPEFRFWTAPLPGTKKRTRIWAIGDSGTADANAAAVRDAYLKFTGSTPTDLWLMLGDNAYDFGADGEYQRAVFDMYPKMLRSTFLWSTIGNHDAYSATALTQQGPYYNIFTLPKAGEIGGVPSGTESYYSFNHGDIHFVCLNSADSSRAPTGAMMAWLNADLLANKSKWTIAYWHHPPYSKGSHDSDNPFEVEMAEMRTNVLPTLEAAGVDLVLTGHSHSYERSFLLNGHYGPSSTLSPSMRIDRGNGRPDSHGAYAKPSTGNAAFEGTVHIVAGSSGKISGGSLDHKAMIVSLNSLGSMVIDIEGNELEAKFLTDQGKVADSFTIRKGVKRTLERDAPTISLGTGGTQTLRVNVGNKHANRPYLILGSRGTTPGFRLSGVHIPLNVDSWFRYTLDQRNSSRFQNTFGVLDFKGTTVARVSLPPIKAAFAVGTVLHHACVVYDASGVKTATNPVSLTLVK